ncbi:MAG: hypothetical protein AAF849_17840 [Bacteroidota bacterium]
MNSQRSNAWKFWLGIAAGAAAGYYLNSDEGRRARRQAVTKANEYGTQIQEKAQVTYQQAAENVNGVLEKGKEQAGRFQKQAKSTINQVSSSLKSTVDASTKAVKKSVKEGQEKINTITV